MPDTVLYRNRKDFDRKIAQIKAAGIETVQLIADFDRTFTKGYVDGKHDTSTFSAIAHSPLMSDAYRAREKELFAHYYPIECNEELPLKQRVASMEEWLATVLALMMEHELPKAVIDDIIDRDCLDPREGAHDLFGLAREYNVPTLVFSAGVGNVIDAYLEHHGLYWDGLHVVSNEIIFDNDGVISGHKLPQITRYGKNERLLIGKPYEPIIRKRRNVLLLGDSTDDANMCDGIEHDTVVKIGFLNKDTPESRLRYFHHYDMLILNDGTMNPVNNLFERIIK